MDTTKEEVTSHDEETPKGPEGPRGPEIAEIPKGINGPIGPSGFGEDKAKQPDELRCRCGNPPRHRVSGWCMRCDFSFKGS